MNRSFTRLTIAATSDELGAVLAAFANGVELGLLVQKGDRYTGRLDLTHQFTDPTWERPVSAGWPFSLPEDPVAAWTADARR